MAYHNKNSQKRQGANKPFGQKGHAPEKAQPFSKSEAPRRPKEAEGEGKFSDIIVGRNPVAEALKSGRVEQIFVAKGERSGSVLPILAKAKELGLPVKEVTKEKLAFLSDAQNHQGIAAQLACIDTVSLEDILNTVDPNKGLVLLLDSIEDPHNLGAILRSAEAAGANGVILPKRRSAPLSAACFKASAGAAAHVKVARVANLSQTADRLKEAGFWLYAAEADGQPYTKAAFFDRHVALVIGSEGQGVSRLLKEQCDSVVSMPMCGQVNSLNASVATGILLYEVLRQRGVE